MTRSTWRALMWTGGPDISRARMLGAGALAWAAYSALQIVANGVVLDETVVPAQIIANAVTYPPGHPHEVFYREAYSLAHFLSAAMWTAVPDAAIISALRNWLFLFVSAFAPFAVTLVLTRRPAWAHAAVAVVLLEAGLRYAGVYPMWVYPNYYSNGHVGLHVVVIAAALLAAGMWRTGGVLIGLMPAVHATLSLALWPWAVLFFLFSPGASGIEPRRRAAIGFGLGLAVSVGLAGLIAVLPSAAAAAAPYVTGMEGPFRDGFIALTDIHRQSLPWFTIPYFTHPIAFGVVSFFLLGAAGRGAGRRPELAGTPGDAAWLVGLGVLAWTIVYGAWGLQQVIGFLPPLVETAMPWRFSNISAVLLPALTVSAVALSVRTLDPSAAGVVRAAFAALVVGAALGALPSLPPPRDMVARNLLLVAWGIILGGALARRETRRAAVGGVALLAGALGVFSFITNAFAYVAVAALGMWAAIVLVRRAPALRARLTSDRAGGVARAALGIGVVVAAVTALPGRTADPVESVRMRWDMISEADRGLAAWLDANAEPDEPVLTPFYPRAELQAKATQPVLLELETLWIMTYMPRLAPVIGTMVAELYGVDYRQPETLAERCGGQVSPWCPVWETAWAERTPERWAELARKYRFGLVLAEADVPVDLPPVWADGHWALYRIPEPARTGPATSGGP